MYAQDGAGAKQRLTPADQLEGVSRQLDTSQVIKSIITSVVLSLVIFSPYFAFQIFIRGNPNPLRTPPRRGFKELDDAVASTRPEAMQRHGQLIFYQEISVFVALFGIVVLFVSLALGETVSAVGGSVVAGVSAAANRLFRALDADATELAFRRRNLFSPSPFVYLASGPEARQQGRWLYSQAVGILIFSAVVGASLLLLA